MHIETWPIERLIPYEKNARIIPQAAIDKVAASLKEFGWQQPIVVDNDGVMIVGHVRRLGALQLGWTECPVHVARGLTAKQVKQYRLMDNRSHEEATWDDDLLRFELGELEPLDLGLTGFELPEIDELLGRNVAGLTDEDDVPEVPEHPVSRLGDLWILGKHRLLCGDSTGMDAVQRLMDGQKADMVFTDPPYGVAVCGGTHDSRDKKNYGKGPKIQNDAMPDKEFLEFLTLIFRNYAIAMKVGAAIYITHADTKGRIFREAFEVSGFLLHCVLIWVKQQFVFGRSDYHWQHEPILYGWQTGVAHQFHGDRNQSTTWSIDRPMRSDKEHPTQKPIALVEKAMNNSSKAGDLILDLFGGSGSTLICCEKTGRSSCLMELDPKYCDVTVKRWQDFTGKTAHLENGQSFERVGEIRRCEREAERCRTEPGTTPSEQLGAIQGEADWLVAKQMAEES